MKSSMFFDFARRNIRLHWLRSLLAVLGIIIGVVTIVSMGILGNGLVLAISDSLSSVGDSIIVSPHSGGMGFGGGGNAPELISERDLEQIQRAVAPHVTIPVYSGSSRMKIGTEDVVGVIYGLKPDDIPILLEIEEGSYLRGSSSAMVGAQFAKQNDIKVGSRVTVGERVRRWSRRFIREVDDHFAWMNRFYVLAANGGLIGPATEAMRFAQMHLNGGELDGERILPAEAVALMQEMQNSTTGNPLGFGLSWFVHDQGEHPFVEHDGGGVGLWAKMRLYPQEGLAIMLMSNANNWDRDKVADAAANVVFTMIGQ